MFCLKRKYLVQTKKEMEGTIIYPCLESQTIIINEEFNSFVNIQIIPDDLKKYGDELFETRGLELSSKPLIKPERLLCNLSGETIYSLRPSEKSSIINHGKDFPSHRKYKTFGKTPSFDDPTKLTSNYMFASTDKSEIEETIPELFKPYFDYLGDCYNHLQINWYENGVDYLPFHKDWSECLNSEKDIVVITLTPATELKDVRNFIIRDAPKKDSSTNIIIPTINGTMISFNVETNNKTRHGITKSKTKIPRISLTFRSFH